MLFQYLALVLLEQSIVNSCVCHCVVTINARW
uniref:Uncharacterized protein n=1 Tax=Arundo donax TaxID=35708 RepID=A0A0A8YAN6_ARUDO